MLQKILPGAGVGAAAFPATTSTVDEYGVGTIRRNAAGNKVYKWVKNVDALIAGVIGYPVCYPLGTDPTMTQVSEPLSANLNAFAGIWCSACACGSYGWIQVEGPCSTAKVKGDGTGVVIGDTLKCVTSESYLVHDQTMGTQAIYASTALAAVATIAAEASCAVILKCVY